MKRLLREAHLPTICEEARCPNRTECFGCGTATFLILGTHCTRNCGFCSVDHGVEEGVSPTEAEGLVQAARALRLHYVVLTVVTRDDLPDGGAGHMALCIRRLKEELPRVRVEILSSDLKGKKEDIAAVLSAKPDVFGHNIETVERLTPRVRPGAHYRRSLDVLREARILAPAVLIKSGLMVGLGETEEEIFSTLNDIRTAGCDIVTIGQYLQPDRNCLPVEDYWEPEAFERWKKKALSLGFSHVFSGPFVRSSYKAHEVFS